mgnify:CR=1 FL=1
MNINRTNYESYFLLYVDRELTAVEMLAVEEFVANNPDLQPELELLQASCLPVETVPFLKKTDLYQTAEISSELQESALLYTDNELTDTERIALETRFNKEPALGQLIKELAQTKLSPAEQVAFPDKSTLYRREPARVISLYFRRIAAAAVIVGAGIHGYVPTDFMAGIMGREAWWSVPLAVALGVPMYSNAAGIVPVVEALLAKGAAFGTVLAFMMSVVALSLPELVILRKVLKPRLIAVFTGVVATGILLVGYVFNLVL